MIDKIKSGDKWVNISNSDRMTVNVTICMYGRVAGPIMRKKLRLQKV